MDLIITFFRDILDGTTYVVVCSVSAVFLCACIGYLAEKRSKRKQPSEESVTQTPQQASVPIQQPTPIGETIPQTPQPLNQPQEELTAENLMQDLNAMSSTIAQTPIDVAVGGNQQTPQIQEDITVATVGIDNQSTPQVPIETQTQPMEQAPPQNNLFQEFDNQINQAPQPIFSQTEATAPATTDVTPPVANTVPSLEGTINENPMNIPNGTPVFQNQMSNPQTPPIANSIPSLDGTVTENPMNPIGGNQQVPEQPVFPGSIDTTGFIQGQAETNTLPQTPPEQQPQVPVTPNQQ